MSGEQRTIEQRATSVLDLLDSDFGLNATKDDRVEMIRVELYAVYREGYTDGVNQDDDGGG